MLTENLHHLCFYFNKRASDMQTKLNILILCILSIFVSDSQSVNTTRLCRHECNVSNTSFSSQSSSNISSSCGEILLFYACRVTIRIDYTNKKLDVSFYGYDENSLEMYYVDYDYAIDQALEIAFYRNIYLNTVTFTCLTDDLCTDEYTSLVIQRLIDSESILYELLPIFLEKSIENRTIVCVNGSNDEIECFGGYCESMTQASVTTWSYHDCVYPSELSVLSTVELTSLTGYYLKYEPENPTNDQINDEKLTLICNVDLCNSVETRQRGAVIMARYNRAAFSFDNIYNTTMEPTSTLSTTTRDLQTTTISSSMSTISSTYLMFGKIM